MNKIVLAILLFPCLTPRAQDYDFEFRALLHAMDTARLFKMLPKWEKASPGDHKVCMAWSEYYLLKSKLTPTDNGETGIVIADDQQPKQPLPDQYIDHNNPVFIDRAMTQIESCIKTFPTQLNSRIRKIEMAGDENRTTAFITEIERLLKDDKKISGKWILPQPERKGLKAPGMLEEVHRAIVNISPYSDSSRNTLHRAYETVLKYYPNDTMSFARDAIIYCLQKKYDKALAQLQKAESVAPSSVFVLYNIAETYRDMKDKANAIRYYERVMQSGDQWYMKPAGRRLEQLRN